MRRGWRMAWMIVLLMGGWSQAAELEVGAPNFTGEWHPVLGVGGVYEARVSGGQPMTWEMTVVGKEGDGYWVEMLLPQAGGTVMKTLVASGGVRRVIVKAGQQPAIEMPSTFVTGTPGTNLKEKGQFAGHEPVTTPAGTFACDHYRVQEDAGVADVWVAAEVSPYGLVKMHSPAVSMVLQRIVTGAKTRITEQPQKFEMPNVAGLSNLLSQGGQGASTQGAEQLPDLSGLADMLKQTGRQQQRRR